MEPNLRDGVRSLLGSALEKGGVERGVKELAVRLEEVCHAEAQLRARPETDYVAIYYDLCQAIPERYGPVLEDTLGRQLADGRVPVEGAAAPAVAADHRRDDPRRCLRGKFFELLARDPRFTRAKARDLAVRIERGCYNAALSRCSDSEESYPRQWTSPMFVNVYSGICGVVISNIDPDGVVAKGVGGSVWALDQIFNGEWAPESLGSKTATELCPQASLKERENIIQRQNQKVVEKTSTLFACPQCRERHCTYRVVQIGAGDEPSTFMCTCKACGVNFEGRR